MKSTAISNQVTGLVSNQNPWQLINNVLLWHSSRFLLSLLILSFSICLSIIFLSCYMELKSYHISKLVSANQFFFL